MPRYRVVALTIVALVAFAANSVLCRLALGGALIDPFAFTAVRLAAGALTLLAILTWRTGDVATRGGSWLAALYLAAYAVPFSLAYVRLGAGTGALLLFGAAQLTMIGLGLRSGERPQALEWLALAGAFGGVVYLVAPGVSAPEPVHALLMILAGVAWGLYSIAGKTAGEPTRATTWNFARAALLVVPATALCSAWLSLSLDGALIAAASGSIASGLGYVAWYAALRDLSATRAALVQLSVPAIAAVGGVVLLHEKISLRLAVAAAVILGSIAIGLWSRQRSAIR